MNSQHPDRQRAAAVVAGLEAWFESIRSGDGFGGPVVGLQRDSVRFCGAGFDWRWEGLLDGWGTRLRQTGDLAYAARLEAGLCAIRAAQLPDGVFRNSYFDHNPFEGGMPHEPILLAAVCRARRTLLEASRPVPAGVDEMLTRYVEEHLIKELWSKQLRTFKDWLQSDFGHYSVHAVAAAVDLLLEYGDSADCAARCEPFIAAAVDSILALQVTRGEMRGALPLSNRRGDAAVPAYAARCLPVLQAVQRRTGRADCAAAGKALAEFLLRCRRVDGTYPPRVFPSRPPAECPLLYGGGAGIVHALLRAGHAEDAGVAAEVERLAAAQSASGGLDTARGFGRRRADGKGPPDWRDVMPVAGWADKAYALLAEVAAGDRGHFTPGPVEREVTVQGQRALFRETGEALAIDSAAGSALFRWTKGRQWAEVSLL
jgi:hypothetical protein